MTVSRETIQAAEKAWQAARFIDDRFGEPDKNRLLMWAELFAKASITAGEAIDAVKDWYLAGGRDRSIQPGDIVTTVRDQRRKIAERQHSDRLLHQTPIDPQLGLPIAGADGKPIWSAYEQHGAIDLPCRTCRAEPNDACINTKTDLVRKIPCVSRLTDGYRATKHHTPT